jgi:uncharacterized protein YidB (DUF937 family)
MALRQEDLLDDDDVQRDVEPVEKHLLKDGGLQDLVADFTGAGLGETVQSWVSPGENKPVSREEVRRAVGDERLREMAQDSGETEDGMAERLARSLPKIVDRLTPDGSMPSVYTITRGIKRFF